ncbi:MAG: putative Ig domain-containing protein [Planctomycetes bacterium]|nr:putative Ig domain-containing protein [Planctomycetota bacterium]
MTASNTFLRRNLFAVLLSFSLSGCSWNCQGSDISSSPQVPIVSYPDTSLALWETLALAPQIPTTQNFTAASFSISPALPAGLSFTSTDGSIQGTPTTAQAGGMYRIDGLDGAGVSVTYTLVWIEIFPAQAPSALSYTPASSAVAVGDALAPMFASVNGVVESFAVAPALPPGLSLDAQTGRIAGTCTGGAGLATYQVTATNPFGSAIASVDIEVLAGLTLRGLLVPSTGDQTLDVFDRRGAGLAPIDSVYVNNGARAVAATGDGRWVFIATAFGRLLRCARDPLSARLEDPVDLGDIGSVRGLAITSDRRFLVAAGDGFVTRYELDDGGVCCPIQVAGPFAPSALELAGDALAIVASSAPGELRVYELEPTFAQRGAALNLGTDVTIAALENYEPGVTFYAATSTYNVSSSSFAGVLRRLRISSAAQVQAGAAALVELQTFNVGVQLTDLRARGLMELLVVDRSLAQLQVWELNATGAIVAGTVTTHALPGSPSLIELDSYEADFFVLDQSDELLRRYYLPIGASNASLRLEFEVRTRRQPRALVPVRGPEASAVADRAFVTSAGDSTLRAVRSTPGQIGAFSATTQGPVATAAAPRAVEAHPRLDVVYTANSGAASLGVYAVDPTDLALSLVEDKALAPLARPISLALTPAGRHLHALDENGRVLSFEVDGVSGELSAVGGLTVQGSMLDSRLRADRLGRFLFVVQPSAGRVTSLTVNLPSGFLLTSNFEGGLPRPIDLWTSPDGRFAYVLDAQLASVFTYSIDRVSGSLVPLGGAFNLGGTPTRLASASAANNFLSNFPTQELLALDGALQRWLGVRRDPANGLLLNSPPPNVYEHPADVREFARMNSDDSLSFATFNLLAIEGPAGARLASGFSESISEQGWDEISSLPLGPGPHALATRVRMR